MSWEIRVRGLGQGRCHVVFHLGNAREFLNFERNAAHKKKFGYAYEKAGLMKQVCCRGGNNKIEKRNGKTRISETTYSP